MEGKLVIEIYEYDEDSSSVPVFEFIPCELAKCMKGKTTTLKDLIKRGFDGLPKRAQDTEKRNEVMQLIEDANIGRINVAFNPARDGMDACVEMINVVPVTLTYADARRVKENDDEIILRGRYKLSEGNEITRLHDAQRLTLTYSGSSENDAYGSGDGDGGAVSKEICLNITYLQE